MFKKNKKQWYQLKHMYPLKVPFIVIKNGVELKKSIKKNFFITSNVLWKCVYIYICVRVWEREKHHLKYDICICVLVMSYKCMIWWKEFPCAIKNDECGKERFPTALNHKLIFILSSKSRRNSEFLMRVALLLMFLWLGRLLFYSCSWLYYNILGWIWQQLKYQKQIKEFPRIIL